MAANHPWAAGRAAWLKGHAAGLSAAAIMCGIAEPVELAMLSVQMALGPAHRLTNSCWTQGLLLTHAG